MAITFRPNTTNLRCVICARAVEPVDATAAGRYADGRQAFAHTSHLDQPSGYLRGWAVFTAKQAADTGRQSAVSPEAPHQHVETLTVTGKRELVHHLPQRLGVGRIVIVHDGNEDGFYSALRKFWNAKVANARRQFAGVPPSPVRDSLGDLVRVMEDTRFTSKAPDLEPRAHVHVVGTAQAPTLPRGCMTFYTMLPLAAPMDYLNTAPPGSLIVQCELQPRPEAKIDVRKNPWNYRTRLFAPRTTSNSEVC
jgi:hypothetical protein